LNSGFLITDAGLAAVTAASPGGPYLHIDHFKIGSGVNYTPNRAQTALQGSVLYTGTPLSYTIIDVNLSQVMCLMDSSVGSFNFGEMGLYLVDGTLFAVCVWDALQEKTRAVGPQAGNTWKIRSMLALAQAPAIVQVTLTYSQGILEVPNWQLLAKPGDQINGANIAIVHEVDQNGNPVLVVRDTDNDWGLINYTETVSCSVSDPGAVVTPTSLKNSALITAGIEAPTSTSKYLIKFSDGQIRKITGLPEVDTITWSPAVNLPTGTISIWVSNAVEEYVYWADTYEYNILAAQVNPYWNLPTGTYPTTNKGMNQVALPTLSRKTITADWLDLLNAMRSISQITNVDPTPITGFNDFIYRPNDPSYAGMETIKNRWLATNAQIPLIETNRNSVNLLYQALTAYTDQTYNIYWLGSQDFQFVFNYTDTNTAKGHANSGHTLLVTPTVTSPVVPEWVNLQTDFATFGALSIGPTGVAAAAGWNATGIGLQALTGVDQVLAQFTNQNNWTVQVLGNRIGSQTTITFRITNLGAGSYAYVPGVMHFAWTSRKASVLTTPTLYNPMLTFIIPSGTSGYQIQRSLRFRSSATAYLNRTFGIPTDNKKWTWSGWVKRGQLGTSQCLFGAGNNSNTVFAGLYIDYNGTSQIKFINFNSSATADRTTSALYRDPSAWMHILCIFDSNNGTALDQVQIWVNGNRITDFSSTTNTSGSSSLLNDQTQGHSIGLVKTATYNTYFDGYLAEVNFVDGQALTPASFGQTDPVTGQWSARKYTGTYGTNGFYLDFTDNTSPTTLANDHSGNGNNWTANNISTTAGVTYDSMLDVPLGSGGAERGNYATLNQLKKGANSTITDGNLIANISYGIDNAGSLGTIGVSSGKWYWEATLSSFGGSYSPPALNIGIANESYTPTVGVGADANGWMYYAMTGQKYTNNSGSAYGATYTTGDVIGIALDMDAGSVTFYKNNASQGVAFTGLGGTIFPAISQFGSTTAVVPFNFGQSPFVYTPPAGFKALHTGNLPTPVIQKPNLYFDTSTYTGNLTARSIVNSGAMQPDLVWIKDRSAANSHALFDSTRGVGIGLRSDSTNTDLTDAASLTAFNANGFSLGTNNPVVYHAVNTADNFVAWQWKKGATPGFDVVAYTGNGAIRTISHALGITPSLMIVKNRSSVMSWPTYHSTVGSTAYMYMNSTQALTVDTSLWNNTAPNSSNFTIGTNSVVNNTGDNFIAVLWSEIPGFSKFGSYIGNGSTDGPFVYCRFRPKFILVKSITATEHWYMYDSVRDTYNPTSLLLWSNLSALEQTASITFDIVSNGFKCRSAGGNANTSGATYIFAAFAEAPFKYALAR
jgi:SPRY domain/Phage tail-collar fibre protein